MRGAENKVNFKRLSQIQILPEAQWNFNSGQDIIKVTVAMICKELRASHTNHHHSHDYYNDHNYDYYNDHNHDYYNDHARDGDGPT